MRTARRPARLSRLAHAQAELTSSAGRAPAAAAAVGEGLGGRALAKLWPCAQCPISNEAEARALHPLKQFGEGSLAFRHPCGS